MATKTILKLVNLQIKRFSKRRKCVYFTKSMIL